MSAGLPQSDSVKLKATSSKTKPRNSVSRSQWSPEAYAVSS